MSLINKVLQDLDRRQAIGTTSTSGVAPVPSTGRHGREWFWRVVTLLLSLGVAWILWTAYQLLPRPLVPEHVYRMVAEGRRTRPAVQPTPAPAPAPAPEAAAEPLAPIKLPPLAAEPLKLAQEIETPVREPVERVKPDAAKPKPVPQAAAKSIVDKRDRARSASDNAEAHFRRAALFLTHGRVSEAEDQLIAALQVDPSHVAARQAYVALLLEQQRVDAARRRLQEALAIDPQHPTFALALARIHAGQRDYAAALEIMDRAGAVARGVDFQVLRGAVLQRLGRHAEAVDAYQNAINAGAQAGTTWVGLAISLEAVGRKAEAAMAYRKALGSGPFAAEAREYAEARARALD